MEPSQKLTYPDNDVDDNCFFLPSLINPETSIVEDKIISLAKFEEFYLKQPEEIKGAIIRKLSKEMYNIDLPNTISTWHQGQLPRQMELNGSTDYETENQPAEVSIDIVNTGGNACTTCGRPVHEEHIAVDDDDDHMEKLTGLMLGISATAGYNSQSQFAKAMNAVGFIASLTAILLHQKGRPNPVNRLLFKFSAMVCAAGALAAIGNDLPIEYIWVGIIAFLVPAIAAVLA